MGWTYKSTNKIGGHHLVEILTLMDLHQNLGMTRNSCELSVFPVPFSYIFMGTKKPALGKPPGSWGDRTAKRVSPWIKLPKSSVQAWLTKCSWAHRKKKHWGKAKIWRKSWFLPEIMLRGLVSVALRNSRNSSNLMFVPWNSQKRPAKSMISFGTPFPCVSHH